jgi:hypothetical protein
MASPRPPHSRRISQTTSSPPSSPPQLSQSQSQSQSQPDPVQSEEPTGMSQDMAGVSVAAASDTELADARTDKAEPHSGNSAPAPMDIDTHLPPKINASEPISDTLDAQPDSVAAPSKATTGARIAAPAPVFETEPELAPDCGPHPVSREPKPSSRTPLALPVFTITTSPGGVDTEEELSLAGFDLASDDQTFDSTLSIGNMSSDCDVSIPASASSLNGARTHTPRRSPRLSGTGNLDVSSTSSITVQTTTSTTSTLPLLRATKQTKTKAKAPARELVVGPSLVAHEAPANTTSAKGKEKERVSRSPSPVVDTGRHDTLKLPQLRSLSPDSDAVLMSLHRTLTPQLRPAFKTLPRSAERPAPPPSAMKRRAEEAEPTSPGKRARFDPDPPPPPPPPIPKPNLARPGRIRVHPSNSLLGMAQQAQTGQGSFMGSHPPIVVRPSGSPSRQQMLLHRPAGPPMRVPVNQPQRVVFPVRVPSPVRTASHNGAASRNPSPAKPQRRADGGLVWQRAPAPAAVPNRVVQSTSQIKPDVVVTPRARSPVDGSSSPTRPGRSRLPVLKSSGVPRATGEKTKARDDGDGNKESGVPPVVGIRSSVVSCLRVLV